MLILEQSAAPPPAREWFQLAMVPATTPSARGFHRIVYDSARGVSLMHGGVSGRGVTILTSGGEWQADGFPAWKYFNDTWEWNGSAWTEVTPEGTRPQAVQAGAGAFDPRRGRLVQFGGSPDAANAVVSRQTWEYGLPELRLTGIDRSLDGNFLIRWTGGAPPYQIQSCSALSAATWQNEGAPTDSLSTTVRRESAAKFFRILSLFGITP